MSAHSQAHALPPDMPETNRHGLTHAEAKAQLKQYGPNRLPEAKPTPLAVLFLRQFLSPLIYILLAAALFSLWMQETSDAVFIAAVLLINAIIGTFQEYSAQNAVNALKHLVPVHATVVRDGETQTIAAEGLCPGDIVLLASGDKVPADTRLLETQSLVVDESLLTGESMPVTKEAGAASGEDAPLVERTDMVFAGTLVSKGRGRGVVVGTGSHTQIGNIAGVTAHGVQAKPPLLHRIEQFTLRLTMVMMGVIALLFILTLARGHDIMEMIPVAIALAVAAVPEGMPAAVTVALAIGMRRMARHNVIIRNMAAVETLGSCTYIASDKTGTLTINDLTVECLTLPDGEKFHVSDMDERIPAGLRLLSIAGGLANEAAISGEEYSGDKVDIALLKLARRHGLDTLNYREVQALPYESENAFSASLRKMQHGYCLYVKGSWEALSPMCSRMKWQDGETELDRPRLEAQLTGMANDGYRVLAFAMREFTALPDNVHIHELLRDLTFLGFAGMIDPLRAEAEHAVRCCRSAGIKVGMVTGDHPATALAIARQLGMAESGDQAVTGQALKKADATGELIGSSTVFARIEPGQKREIVDTLIGQGHYVAVTGDGVNDAPALKRAHVGVAMGGRGTDVARESADIVITDDNFASIVEGVREGRVVYANIRKIIFHFISIGMAEILLFLLTIAAGLPLPLTTVQLLWLNLITGGLQDLPLTLEKAEGDELNRPPRRVGEPILDRLMVERLLLNALLIGGFTFAAFSWLLHQGMPVEDARNIILLLMVAFENIQAFDARSETQSVFRQSLLSNPLLLVGVVLAQGVQIAAMHVPLLQEILHIQPVSASIWGQTLLAALALLAANELYKALRGKRLTYINARQSMPQ